ncbi:MAG TPA: methylated-DNA--[protein]-cysteine S-methyltransferase [Longimicrobiaceae bacterium]|nr:methylated-DNA--[protein]-cysteine S-methyltransferase [Longimicrobiaceae bacterium]
MTGLRRLLLASPVGGLLVEYDDAGVRRIEFWEQGKHPPAGTRDEPARDDVVGRQVVRELREYFAGERREFTLPLAIEGTEFQRSAWDALCRIPCGETRTYGEMARELGRPNASRAVGQANRRNPVPIVVPCHRVLATGGGLGGYLGSWEGGDGTGIKRWLLEHEKRMKNVE